MTTINKHPEASLVQGGPIKGLSLNDLWAKYSGSWQHRLVDAMLKVPHLSTNPRKLAKAAEIDLESVFSIIDDLIALGLVRKHTDGAYVSTTNYVDLNKTPNEPMGRLKDFSNIASEVISRLSPTGPCRYRHQILVTSEKVFHNFLDAYEQALDRLITDSNSCDGELAIGLEFGTTVLADCQKEAQQ